MILVRKSVRYAFEAYYYCCMIGAGFGFDGLDLSVHAGDALAMAFIFFILPLFLQALSGNQIHIQLLQ